MKALYANSEDPYQTPRSVASEECLYCLYMSPKRDFGLKKGLRQTSLFHGENESRVPC